MRIGIDLDDVLHDWYPKAHMMSVQKGITNGKTPRTWHPYREYGCTMEQWHAALDAGIVSGYLYSGLPVFGAKRALQRLKDAGHTVHIVTARGYLSHPEKVRAQTVQWLHKYELPHDTLTFSQDKTIVPTDYFLDDNLDNVEALWAAGTEARLMAQPWNEDAWCYLDRVDSVQEFVDEIIGEAA